jgi:hypothetical protein
VDMAMATNSEGGERVERERAKVDEQARVRVLAPKGVSSGRRCQRASIQTWSAAAGEDKSGRQ